MRLDKNKILICMARKCWDNNDLAVKSGINKAYLQSRILKSKTIRPTTAGAIARALEVDITELLLEE